MKKTQNRYLASCEYHLSNVVSALITNDWNSVLQQCTINSWKEALVAALTHSTNEFPQLCEQLGDRLREQSKTDKSQLKNAILCYICAGSVEKLVDAWKEQTGDHDKLNIEQLHELVEIVIVLQRGALAQGRHIDLSGRVADLLDVYGRFLVSQGKLYSALTYLGDSNDERLVDLRERIYYAIGHKTLPQPQPLPSHNQGPRGSFNMGRNVRSNSSQFGAPPVPQPFNAAPVPQWQPQTNTGFNHFTPAPIPQAVAPPVGPPPPAIEQLSHPPRPASGSGAATSLPRSKYVLDPSVRSNQQPANAFYNQTPIFSGGNNGPMMPQQPTAPQSTPYFQPQSVQPALPPTNTPYFTPSLAPVSKPPTNTSTPFVPQANQPGLPPQPLNASYDNNYMNNQSQSFPEPPPPIFQREKNPTPPPGWNDPPVPIKSRSRTTSVVSYFFF